MNELAVKKLQEALRIGNVVVSFFKDEEDGGTVNFDHPMLMKPDDMTKKEVEESFSRANVRFEYEKSGIYKGWYHIYGVTLGIGNRRTTMAEKFSEALKNFGFTSAVYYQMD